MGPDMEHSTTSATSLPSRPKFSWDFKSPPWADGRGDQQQYVEQVTLWKEVHDTLRDSNPNKIVAELQGIVLNAQLVGRARDLCAKVSLEDLKKTDGAITLAQAIYRIDPLCKSIRYPIN